MLSKRSIITYYRRWVGTKELVEKYAARIQSFNYIDEEPFKNESVEQQWYATNEVLMEGSRDALLAVVITLDSQKSREIAIKRRNEIRDKLKIDLPIIFYDCNKQQCREYLQIEQQQDLNSWQSNVNNNNNNVKTKPHNSFEAIKAKQLLSDLQQDLRESIAQEMKAKSWSPTLFPLFNINVSALVKKIDSLIAQAAADGDDAWIKTEKMISDLLLEECVKENPAIPFSILQKILDRYFSDAVVQYSFTHHSHHSERNSNCLTLEKFIFNCREKTKNKIIESTKEKIIADYLSEHFNELVQTIMEAGYLKTYESEFSYDPVIQNYREFEITRKIHGAQHATRVLLEVLMAFGFAKQMNLAAAKTFSKTDLLFTCIAALFHDIARHADGKDEWEAQSRDACFKFLSSLGLSKKRARFFADSITHDDSNVSSQSFVSILLQSADCLDVMRVRECFYLENVSLFQSLIEQERNNADNYNEFKSKMRKFAGEVRQLIAEQGDLSFKCRGNFTDPNNYRNKSLPYLEEIPEHYDEKIKKTFEHAENCLETMVCQIISDQQFENLRELLNTEESKYILQSIPIDKYSLNKTFS